MTQDSGTQHPPAAVPHPSAPVPHPSTAAPHPSSAVPQPSTAVPHPSTAPHRWRLVATALLIALVVAGIRGASPSVTRHGPWHDHGVLAGAALEAVLAALMLALARRGARAPADAQPAGQLRNWLWVALLLGLVVTPLSIALTLLAKLHRPTPSSPDTSGRQRTPRRLRPDLRRSAAASGHAELIILYVLLALVLLVVITACIIVLTRRRRAARLALADWIDEAASQQDKLGRALQSGQTALRQVDDARAAIIACYVAMERSLAEAGAARADAETPDELLARAVAAGLVRSQAARRLTALFYEARFSSHPLPISRKAAAEGALAALAAEPDPRAALR